MITFLWMIATLTGLFLLVAILTSRQMHIENTIEIDVAPEKVFDFVKYLKNHDTFSVWAMADPEMKKVYSGQDGTVGFVYAWDSNKRNVGAGEQQIVAIANGNTLEYELRFIRPMQDVAKSVMKVIPADNKTKVQWGFYSTMKFPMNAMKPIMMAMLGKSMDTGLSNLKRVLEAK